MTREARRIYLIGICGTAMATLAAMLKRRGLDVRGSDQSVYPPMSDFLASEGIAAHNGYDASHITSDIDFVVSATRSRGGTPSSKKYSIGRSATARCPRRSAISSSGRHGPS